MRIFVDADSCPKSIRTIIIRAAKRLKVEAVFVADRKLSDINGKYLHMRIVTKGDDSADDAIVIEAQKGDLAITHDIILAARLVEKEIMVLDDRGSVFTPENMNERLSVRNAMTQFREFGLFPEKQAPCGPKEVQAFANAFDTVLTKMLRCGDAEIQ